MIEITERDKKIFNILFRLRYMTPKQLSCYLECPLKSVYDRVEKLVKEKYIDSVWVERINKKIYSNGVVVRKKHERDMYKRKVNVNKYTLPHHLLINDAYIHLVKVIGIKEDNLVTERELYWKKTGLLDKSKKKIKMPDMVIEKSERLIAVEVEKTMKNKMLLRDVFKNYSLYTSYYCVRYLCLTESIKNQVIKTAKEENRKFVKAYTIDEFFNGVDIFGF